jgi:hypothetical protein
MVYYNMLRPGCWDSYLELILSSHGSLSLESCHMVECNNSCSALSIR